MQELFANRFRNAPAALLSVPGRVNLLGEWTDFSGGLVLPMALPLEVRLALASNGLGRDRIASAQFTGLAERAIGDAQRGHWSDYVAGALARARELSWVSREGFDVALDSTVPHGSGLSTSAAVTVGVLKMLAPEGTSLTEIAIEARRVENHYIGVPCGIMDQMAVALAAPGHVLALDTATLDYEEVPLPISWQVSIVDSGVSRALADGRYKERRDEIFAAAARLGVTALCRGDPAAAEGLPPPLIARARHVIAEDRRTRAAFAALKAGDIEAFALLMRQGHCSISRDLQITTPEIDAQVALMQRHGALAARQTGGGFGGCIVVLDRAGGTRTWREPLRQAFPQSRLIL